MTHAHDFDFYVGTWQIHNRRLRNSLADSTDWYEFEATSRARPVLGGTGNPTEFEARQRRGSPGLTLRLFDPERDEWLSSTGRAAGVVRRGPPTGRSNQRQSRRVLRRRRLRRPANARRSHLVGDHADLRALGASLRPTRAKRGRRTGSWSRRVSTDRRRRRPLICGHGLSTRVQAAA